MSCRIDKSKRNLFLRGRLEIRLPWSIAGDAFFKACTRCSLCLNVCPENIIVLDRFQYPLLNFHLGSCSFCGACRQACQEAAADAGHTSAFIKDSIPWFLSAKIADNCLAKRGILCRTCGEECEIRAIVFSPQTGGFAIPLVDSSLCTGCGACYHPCPVQAVSLVLSQE